jgi:hypothetical protein
MDFGAAICCRGNMSGRRDVLASLAVLAVNLAALAACGSTADTVRGCPPCPAGTTCVERFDGVCQSRGVECVATTESCPANTCSSACEQALCPAPFQCQNRPPCGGEAVGAFLCYGP